MKKLEMVKTVFQLGVDIGVCAIVTNIVNAVMPPKTKYVTRLCAGVASFIIADMICGQVNKYIDEAWDDYTNKLADVAKNTATKEAPVNG